MSHFAINRVVLIGRLTQDPELHMLPSGLSVCNLRLACNSVRRDEKGEYQEKPNYFDVKVTDASAKNVKRYTCKGNRVAIDGRLDWREWESAQRRKRQAVSVVADTVLFLDGPGEQHEREPSDDADGNEKARDRPSIWPALEPTDDDVLTF